MTTSENSTESKTDSTEAVIETSTTGYTEAPKTEPVKEDDVDAYGYESQETAKTDDKPADAPKEDDKPVENPATGYGKEDEKPAEKPADAPKEDEKPVEGEEKLKAELLEVLKDAEGVDKEKLTAFALENKLSKEQLAGYVKLAKEEEAAQVVAQEQALKTQRNEWKQELMKDPEFGGEHFDKNVDRVEKVLNNYLPNIKKVLTEKGGMLPPYIMRDFLGLAKVLNPTTKFVGGETREIEKSEGNFLDEMYS